MKVLVIDSAETRRTALRRRLEAAGCSVVPRAWKIKGWDDARPAIAEHRIDLAVVHVTEITDRTTLAGAQIPVVVYSGGIVTLPEEVRSQKKVVAFPIPIDQGETEQQTRYIDYLVRSIAGKEPAEIMSDLFDAKTRSFPYVYAMVLLARARLALAGQKRGAADPEHADWWKPLRGPSERHGELLSEIDALTNTAARLVAHGPDFLQRLHRIVQEQQWTKLEPELLGELEALLRLV